MAIAPLIVAVRTTGSTALTRTGAQLRAMGSTVSRLTRTWTAHTRAVSSVAGAYQDANGLWRNANGTLLTQRHTVTQVTTAYGRLAGALRRVSSAGRAAARVVGGQLQRALRASARAAFDLASSVATMAIRIGPLLGVGVALVPVIGNLLGITQLLAPAAVAAGAAFATWKLATKGFADAVKAEDGEELAEALKGLSFHAQKAALTLRDLGREWKSTQKKVQDTFFKGAREDFIMLSRSIQKVADVWLPKLAKAFADARQWIAMAIAQSVDSGQLDRIMTGVHQFIRGLLTTVPYLIQAFLDIAEVAAPSFGEIGDGIAEAARRFAEWIRAMKDSGKLQEWLDKAKTTVGQLKDIADEVGRVLKAIFRGAEGNDFLTNLKNSISELADWLESDNGQAVIDFFVNVGEAAANLIVTISNVVTWFTDGIDDIRETVQGAQDALAAAFGGIGAAATAMFTIIGGGGNAFNWTAGAIGRIGGLVAAVQGAAGLINAALAAIRTTVFIDIITRRFDDGPRGYAKPITGGGGGGGAPKFYAHGGRVSPGRPVVVGDGGRPEMFVPDSAGKILPKVPTGGSTVVQVSMPTNANRGFVDAVIKELRVRVRTQGRGSVQTLLGSSGRL